MEHQIVDGDVSVDQNSSFLTRELFQICPTNTVFWQRRDVADDVCAPACFRASADVDVLNALASRKLSQFTVLWPAGPCQSLLRSATSNCGREFNLKWFLFMVQRGNVLKWHWKGEEQLFKWYRWQWCMQITNAVDERIPKRMYA